ncbi:MAG: cytochrome c [Burkholderiaceae bacterium]
MAQQTKGDPAAASGKTSMCVGCHEIGGYKTAFPTVYQVPMIIHQSEAYIANALKAYRSGERSHPSMRGISGSLSDQDIADLAAFYSKGGKP